MPGRKITPATAWTDLNFAREYGGAGEKNRRRKAVQSISDGGGGNGDCGGGGSGGGYCKVLRGVVSIEPRSRKNEQMPK